MKALNAAPEELVFVFAAGRGGRTGGADAPAWPRSAPRNPVSGFGV